MSIKKIYKDQPETFEFNEKSIQEANKIVSNYPDGKQQSAKMAGGLWVVCVGFRLHYRYRYRLSTFSAVTVPQRFE